jgi:hypothetical protein
VKLTVRGIRIDTRCTDTVWGPELCALVQNSGCTQVIRGLCTDRDARWLKSGEIGTVEASKSHATNLGVWVHEVPLEGQWRCGGSRAYEEWVLKLLGLDSGDPRPWPGDEHFEITLAGSPAEMETILRGKMREKYPARISAGYCWPWSSPRPDDTLVPDVRISDRARPWNGKGDRAIGTAPAGALWVTMVGGFEQMGCLYTAQGFEYDWSGRSSALTWRTWRTSRHGSSHLDPYDVLIVAKHGEKFDREDDTASVYVRARRRPPAAESTHGRRPLAAGRASFLVIRVEEARFELAQESPAEYLPGSHRCRRPAPADNAGPREVVEWCRSESSISAQPHRRPSCSRPRRQYRLVRQLSRGLGLWVMTHA